MLPAPLLAGLRIHFVQRGPKPHCTIADGKFGRVHSPAFEAEQNLAPALRGLAHPILNCQEAFLAAGRDPNNHKGAELVVLTAQAAMDAVSPDIDDWFVVQIRFFPAVVLLGPIPFEPRHRIRRKASGIRAQENLEGWGHFTAGNALQIQPRQGRFQRLGSAHISKGKEPFLGH